MSDKLEVYTKSTKAWFKDAEEGYVVATLQERSVGEKSVVLKFKLDSNGKVSMAGMGWVLMDQDVVYESTVAKLESNNYEDLPPLKNPPRLV